MTHKNLYELSVTTQGPTYPPSEVMDGDGNFIVIGRVNRRGPAGECLSKWSQAIVSTNCVIPAFGENLLGTTAARRRWWMESSLRRFMRRPFRMGNGTPDVGALP
jgi:hypothetical protein